MHRMKFGLASASCDLTLVCLSDHPQKRDSWWCVARTREDNWASAIRLRSLPLFPALLWARGPYARCPAAGTSPSFWQVRFPAVALLGLDPSSIWFVCSWFWKSPLSFGCMVQRIRMLFLWAETHWFKFQGSQSDFTVAPLRKTLNLTCSLHLGWATPSLRPMRYTSQRISNNLIR